jgi:hypothetical protein
MMPEVEGFETLLLLRFFSTSRFFMLTAKG